MPKPATIQDVLEGRALWCVVCGDSLNVLDQIPDSVAHAVPSDPPYGLSEFTTEDIVQALTCWIANQPYVHSKGGFMGHDWDAFVPGPELWRKVHRVLKPGGHGAIFSGTRTQHLMTLALHLAGFQVRDTLAYMFGNGFPKSLDIAKAIDKSEGHWRGRAGGVTTGNQAMTGANYERTEKGAAITELAQQWEGWGTALKPMHEPISLVRKELEGTVIETVSTHGAGGINIDGCRLETQESTRRNPSVVGGSASTNFGKGYAMGGTGHEGGRHPSNVLMSHTEECVLVGTRRVRATAGEAIFKSSLGAQVGGVYGQGHARIGHTFGDEDGTETVEDWRCAPGCPVLEIDHQSSGQQAISLIRKEPLGTVAANVEAHGAGGINIHGCRIGESKRVPGGLSTVSLQGYGGGGGHETGEESGHDPNVGRFPTNVLMTHLPGCREDGVRKVRTAVAVEKEGGTKTNAVFGAYQSLGRTEGYADEDGTETIPNWACAEGCPVATMDAQSGVTKSSISSATPTYAESGPRTSTQSTGFLMGKSGHGRQHDDRGGASRFLYTAKASPKDRWCLARCGCGAHVDRLPILRKRIVSDVKVIPCPNGKCRQGQLVDSLGAATGKPCRKCKGQGVVTVQIFRCTVCQKELTLVTHPTVKPVSVMRWLVRMTVPAKGLAVEPFGGTGTTGEAILREGEGRRVIIIEQRKDYAAIIWKRLSTIEKEIQKGITPDVPDEDENEGE